MWVFQADTCSIEPLNHKNLSPYNHFNWYAWNYFWVTITSKPKNPPKTTRCTSCYLITLCSLLHVSFHSASLVSHSIMCFPRNSHTIHRLKRKTWIIVDTQTFIALPRIPCQKSKYRRYASWLKGQDSHKLSHSDTNGTFKVNNNGLDCDELCHSHSLGNSWSVNPKNYAFCVVFLSAKPVNRNVMTQTFSTSGEATNLSRQAMTHEQPVTTPAKQICSCLLLACSSRCPFSLKIQEAQKSEALDHAT